MSAVRGLRVVDDHEPSTWLRDRVASILRGLKTGEVTCCAHVLMGAERVTALWAADEINCPVCARRRLPLLGDADRACDRCLRVVADDEEIYPGGAQPPTTPPLFVGFGLCRSCLTKEAP